MTLSLDNQTIVITGASQGLGRHLALEALKRNANVVAVGRNATLLKQLEKDALVITSQGDKRLLSIQCDITEKDASRKVVVATTERFGSMDMIIFNAGVSIKDQSILSYEHVRNTFEVNFFSIVQWLSQTISILEKSRSGRVVFISSMGMFYGIPGSNGYNPSKAALSNFAECLRADFFRQRIPIKVTNVIPGLIQTGMITGNKFAPFIVTPENAARIIFKGIEKDKAEIKFPLAMSVVGRFLSLLPVRVVPYITERLVRK